jgi:non-homologous end joining protein Ku
MPPRAVSRSSISFGLVSIPVELFPATASKTVRFNLLHVKDRAEYKRRFIVLLKTR